MKRLVNGMFSSISDAELAIYLDNETAKSDSANEEARDLSKESTPPKVGDDSWLPS